MVGEVQRFLDGGIAAANHGDISAAIEEAVAGGAGRHASALIGFLRRQAQPAGLRAGGDDHRVGQPDIAGIADAAERTLREIDVHDQVMKNFGADVAGLRLHLLHQPGALHRGREAGVVLHVGGDHQLAARLQAGHQHGRQAGARRVDSGGVAGGAGADDENSSAVGLCHSGSTLMR